MNNQLNIPRPQATAASADKVYLEFELDPETLAQVEALARQSRCTAFEMCVKLLKLRLSARRSRVFA
ncbi:MAG TPA: hypothetical protein VNZ64_23795 [Candidatus Acidoferrum sp.]|jgi:hypothetical protein|nr:hypothetical protein [Candidatus Acidoferrum sp.]